MPQQTTSVTLAGVACRLADPRQYPQAAQKANGYYCPVGTHPGTAYVLMLRGELDALQKKGKLDGQPLKLTFTAGKESLTFPRMYFVKAFAVSRGFAGDPNRCYLVELTDVRHFFRPSPIPWHRGNYNVRNPVYANDETGETSAFYIDSLDTEGNTLTGGANHSLEDWYTQVVPWSWKRMLADLWDMLPSGLDLGKPPKLPYTPHSYPEGFQARDTWAADMIDAMLAKLYCTLVYDPVGDKFTIERLGRDQPGLSRAEKGAVVLDDADPIIGQAALFPHRVRIERDRRIPYYLDSDSKAAQNNNIAMSTVYPQDSAYHSQRTEVDGAIVGRDLVLFDDMAALDTHGSTPEILAPDTGALKNESAMRDRSEEVTQNWIDAQGAPWGRKIYQGLPAKIRAGAEVKEIHWRNFERTGQNAGFMTVALKRPTMPDKGATRIDPIFPSAAALYQPAHTERQMRPLYPPRDVHVTIQNWSDDTSFGSANNIILSQSNLFPGHIMFIRPNSTEVEASRAGVDVGNPLAATNNSCGVWVIHAASLCHDLAWSAPGGATFSGQLLQPMPLPCLPAGKILHGRLYSSQIASGRSRPIVVVDDFITLELERRLSGSGDVWRIMWGDVDSGQNLSNLIVANAPDSATETEGARIVVAWMHQHWWTIGFETDTRFVPTDFTPDEENYPLLKAYIDGP